MVVDSESKLLALARNLDENALTFIFNTYYEPLYRYIFFHLKQAKYAEDLTSEVFSRLIDQLHAGRGPTRNLRAWLYRVAHNLSMDELRSRNQVSPERDIAEDAVLDDGDVEEQVFQDILVDQTYEALDQLTTKQRSVIILRYLSGLSNAEAADILGERVNVVKSLRNRGVASLKRHLQPDVVVNEQRKAHEKT